MTQIDYVIMTYLYGAINYKLLIFNGLTTWHS